MAAPSTTLASAACRSVTLRAARTGFARVGVSFRSVRSLIHFARFEDGSASSRSRSIVVGAPPFLGDLIATDRPVARSSRKPIIVS